MIALDTNVLLRYFVQDGDYQAAIATNLIEQRLSPDTPGYISLPVVCEIVWAMQTTYRQPRSVIATSLSLLLDSAQVEVEAQEIVAAALAQTGCDIADAIIHLIGQKQACTKTVTFDKKFARLEGVELLT
jgi:predicted nucleic-acid-binding protein